MGKKLTILKNIESTSDVFRNVLSGGGIWTFFFKFRKDFPNVTENIIYLYEKYYALGSDLTGHMPPPPPLICDCDLPVFVVSL